MASVAHTVATSAVAAGLMLGVREALEPDRQRAAIIQEAADEWPPPPRAVEVHFEAGRPADTWVVLRPWMMEWAR